MLYKIYELADLHDAGIHLAGDPVQPQLLMPALSAVNSGVRVTVVDEGRELAVEVTVITPVVSATASVPAYLVATKSSSQDEKVVPPACFISVTHVLAVLAAKMISETLALFV
jgi:hypothetical protein